MLGVKSSLFLGVCYCHVYWSELTPKKSEFTQCIASWGVLLDVTNNKAGFLYLENSNFVCQDYQ